MKDGDDIPVAATIQSIKKQIVLMNELFQQIGYDLDIFRTSVALLVENEDAGFAALPENGFAIDEQLEHRFL